MTKTQFVTSSSISSKTCFYRPVAGEKQGGVEPPPEIFRFELNSATKKEFCLRKWRAANGNYSFQVLLIIVGLCTVGFLCNLELCIKERNRIFALTKTANSFEEFAYFFFIKIDRSKMDRNAPMTIPELGLLDFIGFLRGPPL